MNGVLLIDKPAGVTSRYVDNQVRRKVGGRKMRVGHAGTLDPFATGVLPVMIGEATKLSAFLTGSTKKYSARLRLGEKTTTGDNESPVSESSDVPVLDISAVTEAMRKLTGRIEQTPSIFSAIKQNGRPLYEMARLGEAVVAPARTIEIFEWKLDELRKTEIDFTVVCGSGTYVRTLGEQLSVLLGTVGHLTSLRRLQAGILTADQAVSLDEGLERLPLIPIESAIDLPRVNLSAAACREISYGRPVTLDADDVPPVESTLPAVIQALDEDGKLLALLERMTESPESPWRVLRGFQRSAKEDCR